MTVEQHAHLVSAETQGFGRYLRANGVVHYGIHRVQAGTAEMKVYLDLAKEGKILFAASMKATVAC